MPSFLPLSGLIFSRAIYAMRGSQYHKVEAAV